MHYLFSTYYGIKSRCYDRLNPNYKNYGGRGIQMYPEWKYDKYKFITYVLNHLGDRPHAHILDRIDNDKGYEPNNIRWSPRSEQNNNKRPQRNGVPVPQVVYKEEKMSHAECARRLNKTREYVRQVRIFRIKNNHGLIFAD